MSNTCFQFLSHLPPLFRHLRHLAIILKVFLLHIIKIKQKKNLKNPHQNLRKKDVIKLGAGAVLDLVATNRLENWP